MTSDRSANAAIDEARPQASSCDDRIVTMLLEQVAVQTALPAFIVVAIAVAAVAPALSVEGINTFQLRYWS